MAVRGATTMRARMRMVHAGASLGSRMRACTRKPSRANGRIPKPATASRRTGEWFAGWLWGVASEGSGGDARSLSRRSLRARRAPGMSPSRPLMFVLASV